jgi:hypothetical protein
LAGCSRRMWFVSASHGSLSSAPSRNLMNMTPDLWGYAGQSTHSSSSPMATGSMLMLALPFCPPSDNFPLTALPALLPAWPSDPPSLQTLPLSSLLNSHVSLSLPPFLCSYIAGFSDWWLSLLPPTHTGYSLADCLPWRWRRHVPPKCRFDSQELHGATSQKTAFFIVTSVKTSKLTKYSGG